MVGSTGNANFCQGDYVVIPMATNVGRMITGPSLNVDRLCGGVLSADITLQSTTVRSKLPILMNNHNHFVANRILTRSV